jgi:uncharacterized protein (DUF1697 family)
VKTYLVLLRAVNVGGTNSLPTKDFVRVLEKTGLGSVRTYIQTGNAVFNASSKEGTGLSQKIKDRILVSHGFAPEVILLRLDELEDAVAANPYPGANSNPKSLHLAFLASAPGNPDLTALEKWRTESEQYSLQGRVFYFYAPEGVGRSKLFSRIEKVLGVGGTARNWRTVCKLLELAREVAVTGGKLPTTKR